MNDKILKLATSLLNNKECYGIRFSLDLNYKKVIKDHEYIYDEILKKEKNYYKNINTKFTSLDENGLKQIEDCLSIEKANNFNLTIEFTHDVTKYENIYLKNWYSCRFIFCGEGKLEVVFDMLSNRYGFSQSEFNQFFDGKEVIIDENKIPETIQNLVDLKNLLIKNGNILTEQLNKFK